MILREQTYQLYILGYLASDSHQVIYFRCHFIFWPDNFPIVSPSPSPLSPPSSPSLSLSFYDPQRDDHCYNPLSPKFMSPDFFISIFWGWQFRPKIAMSRQWQCYSVQLGYNNHGYNELNLLNVLGPRCSFKYIKLHESRL